MYAHQMDVERPLEMYDAVHAEVNKRIGQNIADGSLMHMVTKTATGFRVTEVWESHEAADRFGDEVMRPVIEIVAGPDAVADGPPPSDELDLHALLTASTSNSSV